MKVKFVKIISQLEVIFYKASQLGMALIDFPNEVMQLFNTLPSWHNIKPHIVMLLEKLKYKQQNWILSKTKQEVEVPHITELVEFFLLVVHRMIVITVADHHPPV